MAQTTTHTSMTHQQHTLDWYRSRLGHITGSQVGEIFSKARAKDDTFSKTALSYLTSIAAEQMIPPSIIDDDQTFTLYLDEINTTSKAMRIGSQREAEARTLYTEITDSNVRECGCIHHPSIPGFASSPDGLILDDDNNTTIGTIEIKCPRPSTYLEYLSTVHTPRDLHTINTNYYWQCISHIAVTGALWCDFIVYCPYISNPIHIIRIHRDPQALSQLSDRLTLALRHIHTITDKARQSTTNIYR